MKTLTAIFAILTVTPSAYAQDPLSSPEYKRGLLTCLKGRLERPPSFESDYDRGASTAKLLNAFDAVDGVLGGVPWNRYKKLFMKTQSDFKWAVAEVSLYVGKGKDMDALGCRIANLEPLGSRPWSALHSGLSDYLNPELKKIFVNAPMR